MKTKRFILRFIISVCACIPVHTFAGECGSQTVRFRTFQNSYFDEFLFENHDAAYEATDIINEIIKYGTVYMFPASIIAISNSTRAINLNSGRAWECDNEACTHGTVVVPGADTFFRLSPVSDYKNTVFVCTTDSPIDDKWVSHTLSPCPTDDMENYTKITPYIMEVPSDIIRTYFKHKSSDTFCYTEQEYDPNAKNPQDDATYEKLLNAIQQRINRRAQKENDTTE